MLGTQKELPAGFAYNVKPVDARVFVDDVVQYGATASASRADLSFPW